MRFYGRVYANPKDTLADCERVELGAPWDLTRRHVERFAPLLVGKPIRVEHNSTRVGRICSAGVDARDGSLYIAFDLDASLAGQTAQELVRSGAAPELSLRHDYHSGLDGMTVEEVSLVARGARKGCSLLREEDIRALGLGALTTAPTLSVMASAATPADESPAKRKREDLTNTEYISELAKQLTDDDARQLFDRFAKVSETAIAADSELKSLRAKYEDLEARIQSDKKTQEASSGEIIRVLNEMYGAAAQGSKLPEEVSKQACGELANSNNLLSLLGTVVPVACSALQRASLDRQAFDRERTHLANLEQQLTRMGAAPVAAERVAVKASSSEAPPTKMQLPGYLENAFSRGDAVDGTVKHGDVYIARS